MRRLYIILLSLTSLVLLFSLLSYITPLGRNKTEDIKNPHASLYFTNSNLESASGSAIISSEIILDTNTPISIVQIELSFDPRMISNVSINPAENNFFGDESTYSISLSEVRQEIGRVSFAIEQNPNVSEREGTYPIAVVQFQTLQNSGDYFTFLEKSSVLKRGKRESILTNTSALSSFKKTSTPSSQLNESLKN